MVLSIEFAMPGPSFDPNKYSRKPAARTANVTKPVSMPKIKEPTADFLPQACDATVMPEENTSLPQTCDAKEMSKENNSLAQTTDTKATTSVLEPTESAFTTNCTTGPTKVTTTEKMKTAVIPDVEAGQPSSLQASEEECANLRGEDTKAATVSELEIEQHASIPAPEVERTKPSTEKTHRYPPSILTAEFLDLAFMRFRARDDKELSPSTETRRLVSLRRIRNICQAKVENQWMTLAQVDEWTSIVPRYAFKEGDLVVYVQIDAFLPASDKRFGLFSSLQTFDGDIGHRVKTRTFGSYPDQLVVQGYIYPLEKFNEIYQEINSIRQAVDNYPDDKPSDEKFQRIVRSMYKNEDWAAKIGVKKWEEPKPVNPPNKHPRLGAIPTRVFKKTDITHFEDCPNLFTKVKYFTREYQESIKMDGASMTVYFVRKRVKKYHDLNDLPEEVGPNTVLENGRFGVTSKAVDLNELNPDAFGYWKTALKNDLPAKLSELNRSIAIHGEICGPGINMNREKLQEKQFFVYSIWDIVAQKYFDPRKVEELAAKLDLKHVPVLGYVKIREIASNHKELRDLAEKRPGEGLVYKCVNDGRSFKVHSTAYKVQHNC